MDPASIVGAASEVIAIGQRIVDRLKGAADLAKSIGKAEVMPDLIDAQMALMELLQKQHDLIDENRRLRDRLLECESQIATKGKLGVFHGAYWMTEPGGTLDGPFSMTPYDTESKLVRLSFSFFGTFGGTAKAQFVCNVTDTMVQVPFSFIQDRCPRLASEIHG